MDKVIIFLILVLTSCAQLKNNPRLLERDVIKAISLDLMNKCNTSFSCIESGAKVNTGFFEDVDSVAHSVGYALFDELVANSKHFQGSGSTQKLSAKRAPYLLFSQVIFDQPKEHCMVSYSKYYGPLHGEEVCAIYRIARTKERKISVVLLWSHSISVS